MDDAITPGPASEPGFDLGAAPASAETGAGYRVLARKYRPSNFDDLIGQDAMVRTLSNAFETGRIPQAWILTGVRGVGKTTTARILARALNYELPDGSITGPTIKLDRLGIHCKAIMESQHLDVIEMDAASHNGVEDVRQINDAVRYAPVSARYKVYILDEVHMLSTAAFNALLKTLEEPPPHAKFIFATTEIRKVPVTVLSRCQRFDLRRIDNALMATHLDGIAGKENVVAEPEALALVARAAEGSVRDALSLFDQAIAHAAGGVRAQDVRTMLGLADKARIIDLFESLMKGDVASALTELREQYDSGADPSVVLADLAEFTHFVTRVKVVPAVADDISLVEDERVRGRAFAATLSMRVLSRTWQMLLKGIAEVQSAGRPIAAAEMVLVRIAYAADLPTPDEALRMLADGSAAPASQASAAGASAPSSSAPSSSATSASAAPRYDAPRAPIRAIQGGAAVATAARPIASPIPRAVEPAAAGPSLVVSTFADLVALAAEKRDLQIKAALERDVRLVRFEDGLLEIALEPRAAPNLINDLIAKLRLWTNRQWSVIASREAGAPTLKAQADERKAAFEVSALSDPLVLAVMERFPGAVATVLSTGKFEPSAAAPYDAGPDDVLPPVEESDFDDNWVRDDD